MPYPSTVTSFTNPLPGDKLNSPSHSSIETAQNTGLTELQTFVGTLSSAVGTLVYDIRAAASNGGGHVQTVNKGGTGQTTYTKGDLLVATSASVLAKFAVGLDGQALVSDSSVAAGIKWSSQNTFSNKIEVNGSVRTIGASVAANSDQSVLNVLIPGSTLGTNNAIRANLYISSFDKNLNAGSVILVGRYGGNAIASIALGGIFSGNQGVLQYTLMAQNSSVAQSNIIEFQFIPQTTTSGPNLSSIVGGVFTGTTSINTSADAVLGITARWQDNSPSNGISLRGYTVEKIA